MGGRRFGSNRPELPQQKKEKGELENYSSNFADRPGSEMEDVPSDREQARSGKV